MAKAKAKKILTSKTPALAEGEYEVRQVMEMNNFDLTGERNKTKGTSNKFYHAELQVEKNGDRAQVFTMYGATGRVQARDYRHEYDDGTPLDEAAAKKEFDRLVKSKQRKGYKEVKVAQRALGSDDAKKITAPVVLNNAGHLKKQSRVSSLTDAQRTIVQTFFGASNHFVAQTLKCPLGQLTNEQIDDGRECLNAAKKIVNTAKGSLSTRDNKALLDLTNQFYGLIPHNLGGGARGQMTHLLLDTLDKIMGKEDDLDTLLDAKQVNAVLKADSDEDDKYRSLNCDFGEVAPGSDLFKFIASYYDKTKVQQHNVARGTRVVRIYSMKRKDAKEQAFIANAERIAKACGNHTFARAASKLSGGSSKLWVPGNRPDLDKDQVKLFTAANVWLCWHGTRSANLLGITRRGLLIRPSGAVHTGSMFGDGKYFAWQSSKSLNYCDGGSWTGNTSRGTKWMFLLDVAMGKQHEVTSSHFFRSAPRGCHSVYAKADRGSGYGTLYNDEMITYDFNDRDNQSQMAYLLEIR
jgi:poly [ADP-ribose] polymerase